MNKFVTLIKSYVSNSQCVRTLDEMRRRERRKRKSNHTGSLLHRGVASWSQFSTPSRVRHAVLCEITVTEMFTEHDSLMIIMIVHYGL